MIRNRAWIHALFIAFVTILPLMRCTGDAGTGKIDEPGIIEGTLREPDGVHPADSVLVKIFTAGSVEERPAAVAMTDAEGHFSVSGLSDGYYSLLAEKGSSVLFHDSLPVTFDRPVSTDATLECSGTLSGIVGLQPGDDPRTVTLCLAGTGKLRIIDNPKGSFTIAGLARGSYTLHIASTLPNYLPTSTTARIHGCTTPVAADSFGIMYTGIPPVSGIRIAQDTATGLITISWKKCHYPDLRDHVLYRDTSVSGNSPFILFGATRDTVVTDTIFRSLKPAPSDTAIRRCRYRIAVRDNGERIGPTPQTIEFPFQPKSSVTTFFTRQILNKPEKQQMCTRGDTLLIALSAYNRTRSLHRLVWYDAANRDTLGIDSSSSSPVRELTGSMRFVFRTSADDTLLAIVSDKVGNRWIDTILLRTINDFPDVFAGNDTGVFLGEKVCFHGRATQRTGFLTKWEWKIGPGAWTTAGPDLCLNAPVSETILVCSLAVTDDFGNRSACAARIFSTAKVRSMLAGSSRSLILKTDGTLLGCGQNDEYSMHDSILPRIVNPALMLTDVKEIALGYGFTLMLQSDGMLWGRGNNLYSQLGNGSTTLLRNATMIMPGVAHIAAAGWHSFIVKQDGSLWACGMNDLGQLGTGTVTTQRVPVEVMKDVFKVATSEMHTLILKTDGTLWVCGLNAYGQLGDGTRRQRLTPVSVMSGIRDIAAGGAYSMILKNDSTLWTCGNNQNGMLGDGTRKNQSIPVKVMEHVVRISAGSEHALVLTASDSVWGFGVGANGQLGPSGSANNLSPIPIIDAVTEISAGYGHSLFLKRDGTLWGCGYGSSGQLGTIGLPNIRELLRVVPPEDPYWVE